MLGFVDVSRTIVSTVRRVLTSSILGAGDPGDVASAERVDGCEVVQPLGLFARPVLSATTEALVARLADSPVILAIIDKGRAAQNVEEGEVRIYGPGSANAAATIRVRADGSIEITATDGRNVSISVSGAGDVVLDGGTLKSARVTDPVRIGTVTGTAGPYPVTFTTTLVDADGTPGTPVVGAAAALSGVVSNAGGAAHVKA